ncbi:MAG: hypothetical protein ACRC76_01855 [Proteocatella sp.]
MDIKTLISKDINEVEAILKAENIAYQIEEIAGNKDKDILCDKCVIRVIEKQGSLVLTVTNFKTHI